MLRRKAEEEEQKAALVVGAGGGGVGARPHEYENARRENSCHCLTQPTPTPCPAPSKRSLCLQLPRKGERRGELQATPWLASALALHCLPLCLPSPSAATSSSDSSCCLNIYAFDIFVTRTWQRVAPSTSIKKLYAKSKLHVQHKQQQTGATTITTIATSII